MFYEIEGCTYRDVNGFFGRYFEGRRRSWKSKAIYNAAKTQCRDGRWTDFPNPPDEDAVWDWMSRFLDKQLSDSNGILYMTECTSHLIGGEAQRQKSVYKEMRHRSKRKACLEGCACHWRTQTIEVDPEKDFAATDQVYARFLHRSAHPPLHPRLLLTRRHHGFVGL